MLEEGRKTVMVMATIDTAIAGSSSRADGGGGYRGSWGQRNMVRGVLTVRRDV